MIWIDHPVIFWSMVVIQVVGLLSMAATRVGEHTSRCLLCRCLFLVSLVVVGGATVLSLASGTGHWAAGGTTLSLMVVGGTLDFGGDRQRSAC